MNKKLKVMVKFINSAACNYVDTKIYIAENLTGKTVEDIIHFVFEFFERINVLLFHALTILL